MGATADHQGRHRDEAPQPHLVSSAKVKLPTCVRCLHADFAAPREAHQGADIAARCEDSAWRLFTAILIAGRWVLVPGPWDAFEVLVTWESAIMSAAMLMHPRIPALTCTSGICPMLESAIYLSSYPIPKSHWAIGSGMMQCADDCRSVASWPATVFPAAMTLSYTFTEAECFCEGLTWNACSRKHLLREKG